MTGKTKAWVTAAAVLTILGITIFGGLMTMLKWDFSKLSTVKHETSEFQIHDTFTNISLNTKTSDVKLAVTDKETPYVSLYEQKKLNHTVTVEDGTLKIELHDTRKWYDYIGINFASSEITVYLPAGAYGFFNVKTSTGDVNLPKELSFESIDVSGSTGDVNCYASVTGEAKIKVNTGDIKLESLSVGSLDIAVSTGDITASNVSCAENFRSSCSTGKMKFSSVTCHALVSDGDTGDMILNSVTATEKFIITRDTGDVRLDGCDASEIFITTDTGDVKGSLLSEKVFIARSKTGKTDTPKTVNGGRCEITTDTGDIIISIIKIED